MAFTSHVQRDGHKTYETIAHALETAQMLGMARLEQTAREALDKLGEVTPAYPAQLTKRELEVLALIAAGRKNQQIADELVISFHTVNRHVTNVLAKTGASNRTEAAAFANRHHLN